MWGARDQRDNFCLEKIAPVTPGNWGINWNDAATGMFKKGATHHPHGEEKCETRKTSERNLGQIANVAAGAAGRINKMDKTVEGNDAKERPTTLQAQARVEHNLHEPS